MASTSHSHPVFSTSTWAIFFATFFLFLFQTQASSIFPRSSASSSLLGDLYSNWDGDSIKYEGDVQQLRRYVRAAAAAAATAEATTTGPPPEPTGPPKPTGPGLKEKVVEGAKVVFETGKVVGEKAIVLGEKAKDLGIKGAEFASEKTKIPLWGTLLILVGIVLALFGLCLFLIRKQWRKFRGKDKDKEGGETEDDTAQLTMTEVEPEPPEEKEKIGRLNYKLVYDFDTNNLTVGIVACEELVAMDSSGTSDPYVKVFFAGDKKKKFETKVHRKSLNPVFNETFVFKSIPFADIMAKTLMIQVFDFDRFGKHDQIGEIRIAMCQIDLAVPIEGWKDLDPPADEDSDALGDICFSLRYVPTSGKLTVCILECKNLKKMDFGGLSDPFVKINLYLDGKKSMKKKTSVKKGTLNPYFNESFTFEIQPEKLPKCHLVVTVLDYDRIGTCDPIGRIGVGSNQDGKGLQHWQEMINTPRRPIAQWHTLRDPDEYKQQEAEKQNTK